MNLGDVTMVPDAGWYPDHENDALERWWTGHNWSDKRQQRGGKPVPTVQSTPADAGQEMYHPVVLGQDQYAYAAAPALAEAQIAQPASLGQPSYLPQAQFGQMAYAAPVQQVPFTQAAGASVDPYGYGYVPVRITRRNGQAIASLVVGIIAITVAVVAARTGYFSTIGVVLAIVLGVRGLIASKETFSGKAMSIIGIVLGALSGGVTLFVLFGYMLVGSLGLGFGGVSMTSVESGIQQEILKQSNITSVVDCPDGHSFNKGDTLTCTATLSDGRVSTVDVSVVDGNGGFTFIANEPTDATGQ